MKKVAACFLAVFITSFFGSAQAWFDKTHIAIGKAAGFDRADYLAAPDIAKVKAHDAESYNHWASSAEGEAITAKTVRGQIVKYNLGIVEERRGHLYGAIVAAVRAYQDEVAAGNYAVYHIIYAGHYIGDLSMPLHNSAYDEFNATHRALNDGIVERQVLANLEKIRVYPITIKTEDDLIDHIVRIAQKAKNLGQKMEKENRNMTLEEAYSQLSDSASLFKAVLEYVRYPEKERENSTITVDH